MAFGDLHGNQIKTRFLPPAQRYSYPAAVNIDKYQLRKNCKQVGLGALKLLILLSAQECLGNFHDYKLNTAERDFLNLPLTKIVEIKRSDL